MRRRPRPRAQPARPSAAELRSGWRWLRAFPLRSWRLLRTMWVKDPRHSLLVVLALAALAGVLAVLGAGGTEISEILATVVLGALVLAVSRDHRTVGAVVVTVLSLSLVGTLAGPRWTPEPLTTDMTPVTSDTRIGGDVLTTPVGAYEIETVTVTVTQADGRTVPALLRRPVGARTPTPGVVFLHGAGTQSIEGFAEQASALASAGITTLVPTKPMEDYSTTVRDYPAMAEDYQRSVDYLRSLDGVAPGRVGLYAESEGGYPGVVLAARDQRTAFLVLASAPVVELRRQATFAAGSYLERVGVPSPLLTIIARVLGSQDMPGGGFDYADFDARPYEEQVSAPVLMVYGAGDDSMPLVQGPLTIRQSLAVNGNTALTVRYYEGANHGLKLGASTEGALAPGVARDLARWVNGLPITAEALPHVAGAAPVQEYWARAPGPTRWYASGDLMLAALALGLGLMVLSTAVWLAGQGPRLRGRRGLHLPDPLGRWTASLCLSVVAAWVLYLAYIWAVVALAMSYRTNHWLSYGGWLLAQATALGSVVLLVKLVQRALAMRTGPPGATVTITAPGRVVLASAVTGAVILLIALSYWGLFPMLV